MAKRPISSIRAWHARYGDTFRVPVYGTDYVMTCDPDLVREIHANRDPELFLSVVPDAIAPLFGARSILRLADEAHDRERKLMMPPFHGDSMRSWAKTIQEVSRRAFMVGQGPFRAMDCTQRITLEVILRVVFGVRDEERVRTFHAAVEEWSEAIDPLFIFFPILARDWLGLAPYARYRVLSAQLDAMLDEQVAAARAAPPSDDVLSMLIHARHDDGTRMDDVTLRDNLRTLLFAGHDTTAITLAWAIYFIHRHPEVLARARRDVDALGPRPEPAALAKLPYLNAIIDETLRVRPISSETQRRLAKPWKLGEWDLPAGITLSASQLLLHYDARSWDRPHDFDPSRFLGRSPSPHVYSPFGGGNRRCLGATFARYEAAIVLGTALSELEFELLDRDVEWGRGKLVLEPVGGVRVRARRRPAKEQVNASSAQAW